MVRFGKKVAVLTLAGAIAAMSVTGCGSIKEDATVATVGEEKITLGVANFYARLQQGQYETYYAGMMGTTGEAMWSQDASDGKDYEEQTKDNIMESLENLYLLSQHASEYNVSLSVLGVGVVDQAHGETIGKDDTARQGEAIDDEPQGHEGNGEMLHAARRQKEEDDEGENDVGQPPREMAEKAPESQIVVVEKHQKGAAEEPVGKVIGSEVHHDGRLLPLEAGRDEEMHRIVGRQRQQSPSHKTAGAQVVAEDALVRSLRHEEIEGEEQHQHQGNAERIFVKCAAQWYHKLSI